MWEGRKTYIVAALSGLIAFFEYTHEEPQFGTLFVIIGAGLATIRNAIANQK